MTSGPGDPEDPEDPDTAGSTGPVAVCVLRLERRGGVLAVTVSATPDVRCGDGERFVTSSLEEALDVVRALAERIRGVPG